jgi:hypothetical protein
MSTKILVTLIAFGFLVGCSKDKFTTKPQLTFKKVNTNVVKRNEVLRFTLGVTDLEGDLQDTVWVQKLVRNCPASGRIAAYRFPAITAVSNFSGEIEVCYTYGINPDQNSRCPSLVEPQCVGRNDSATYRFWIQDSKKNVSDTARSTEVVIVQQ